MINATAAVIVLKFGGSSLATDELREIAASRVLDVVRRGDAPVVVSSTSSMITI